MAKTKKQKQKANSVDISSSTALVILILSILIGGVLLFLSQNPQIAKDLNAKLNLVPKPYKKSAVPLQNDPPVVSEPVQPVLSVWKGVSPENRGEFISADEKIESKKWDVECENESPKFKDCSPTKCGRFIKDNFITKTEAKMLIGIAEKAMHYGEAEKGVTIFDLASGGVTYKDKFVDSYKMTNALHEADPTNPNALLTDDEVELLQNVYGRILFEVGSAFNIKSVYLGFPNFFSRIESSTEKSDYEFFFPHADNEIYKSFEYTAHLYLTSHDQDFSGGEFIYLDRPATPHNSDIKIHDESNQIVELKQKTRQSIIQPKTGRLQIYTSGHENLHVVEKVGKGRRYMFTVGFTCDKGKRAVDLLKKALYGFESEE
ncbi:2-oxoglutarate and iron-dependent oxygenase domain-containing protein 3 [Nowakowskiella sp. JEL0407]|nr:2-oxoglutarate and iron-dependent oxygenase domain-containing protein 3 [Nowakowskiella sp. JEL0407]